MWDGMVPLMTSRKKIIIKHRYIVFVTEKDVFILRDFAGFIHRLNTVKKKEAIRRKKSD